MLIRAANEGRSQQPVRPLAGWSLQWSTWALRCCLLGWMVLAWVVLHVGYDRTPLLDREQAVPQSVPADRLADAYHALWAATAGLAVADIVVLAVFVVWTRGRGECPRSLPVTDGWAVAAWRVRALRMLCPREPASDIWWAIQRRQQLRRLGPPRGASAGLKISFGWSIFWAVGAVPALDGQDREFHEADGVWLLGMYHLVLAVLLLRVVEGAPAPDNILTRPALSLEVR